MRRTRGRAGTIVMFCRPESAWNHEMGSFMMLDYMIDDNHLDYDAHDIRFLKDLIHSERAP